MRIRQRLFFSELTPQQAFKKIEAWKEKQEIKLGDEVINTNKGSSQYNLKGVVIELIASGTKKVMWSNGKVNKMQKTHIEKTGNNYAEDVKALLNKIGG